VPHAEAQVADVEVLRYWPTMRPVASTRIEVL
jgi:hypothetical protein